MKQPLSARLSTAAGLLLLSSAAVATPLDEERDCVIGPHEVVEVSSAVPGLLEEVLAERSDSVSAGQLIARLESRVEQASLELARAWASIDSEVRIEQTSGALDKRRHDRIAQLYESRAVALDDRDRAQTEASLAALRLRQAREKRWIRELDAQKAEAALERRAVRSPIDGVVVERFRAAGEYVENQPIMRIASLDPLQVETVLPMALFGQVRAGMVAEVRAENAPETAHRAVVRVVDRMGDAASGTFGVRLMLPNSDNDIAAGLRCRLRLLPGEWADLSDAITPMDGTGAESLSSDAEHDSTSETVESPQQVPAVLPSGTLVPAAALSVQPSKPARPPSTPNTHEERAAGLVTAPQRAELKPSCASIGPLRDAAGAAKLAETIAARGIGARVERRAIAEAIGYIVVSPRQETLDAAFQLSRDLARLGVVDTQVMPRGEFARRVSVGVYDGDAMAHKRRAQVAGLGVDMEVLARTRSQRRWWVRTEQSVADLELPAGLATGVSVAPAGCSETEAERVDLVAVTHSRP